MKNLVTFAKKATLAAVTVAAAMIPAANAFAEEAAATTGGSTWGSSLPIRRMVSHDDINAA